LPKYVDITPNDYEDLNSLIFKSTIPISVPKSPCFDIYVQEYDFPSITLKNIRHWALLNCDLDELPSIPANKEYGSLYSDFLIGKFIMFYFYYSVNDVKWEKRKDKRLLNPSDIFQKLDWDLVRSKSNKNNRSKWMINMMINEDPDRLIKLCNRFETAHRILLSPVFIGLGGQD